MPNRETEKFTSSLRLHRSDRLPPLLEMHCAHSLLGEVIVINNVRNSLTLGHREVRVFNHDAKIRALSSAFVRTTHPDPVAGQGRHAVSLFSIRRNVDRGADHPAKGHSRGWLRDRGGFRGDQIPAAAPSLCLPA